MGSIIGVLIIVGLCGYITWLTIERQNGEKDTKAGRTLNAQKAYLQAYLAELRGTTNYPLLRVANAAFSFLTGLALVIWGVQFVRAGERLENGDLQAWGWALMVASPIGAAFEFGIVRMVIDHVDAGLQRSRRQG